MSKPRSVVTLGDKVRAARLKKNLSQYELAQQAGVRPEVVSRIETGKSSASLTSLHKIGPVLDLTLEELTKDQAAFHAAGKRKGKQ